MNRGVGWIVRSSYILALALASAVLGVFLYNNAHWVVVRFPTLHLNWANPIGFVEFEIRLALLLLIGFACGAALVIPGWFRRAWERGRSRRFIDTLEGELADLRNLPVTDPAPLEDIDADPDEEQDPDEEGDVSDDALLISALSGDRAGANR